MGLQRWHRNIVVVLTALIAVLAMHGLTSEHGMGMPGMRVTAGSVMTVAVGNPVDAIAMAAVVVSADSHTGRAGGMCVGILGTALLLWLIARSRRRQLRVTSFGFTSAARAIQARAGPLPPRLRPSLVKLGISRT